LRSWKNWRNSLDSFSSFFDACGLVGAVFQTSTGGGVELGYAHLGFTSSKVLSRVLEKKVYLGLSEARYFLAH
jgi:hypothetical protein